MKVYTWSAWVNFSPKIYNGSTWVPATTYVGNAAGWQAWVYDTADHNLGSAEVVYWIDATFNWTPPSNRRVVSLYAEGWCVQHVPVEENQAVMDLSIEGWNGSSWVQLAYSRRGADGGGTFTTAVSCSFNPYNTAYSQFRFRNTGNSFTRGVTGYLTDSYLLNTINYV